MGRISSQISEVGRLMPEMQYHSSGRVKIQNQAKRKRCQDLSNGAHLSQVCECSAASEPGMEEGER